MRRGNASAPLFVCAVVIVAWATMACGDVPASGAGASGRAGSPVPVLPPPTLGAAAMGELAFGAFGDVRPAHPDDTASYPDAVLSAIFAGLQRKGVSLTVDAGDHCFQSSVAGGSYGHAQFIDHFMAARRAYYAGTLLPTMGNHEGCGRNAATSANCTTWASGLVRDYLLDVVEPNTGQSAFPYYSIVLYGSWGTAKIVDIAANAWSRAQSAWLARTLDVATTYTFVVRHEPSTDPRAPGVAPSESLYRAHYRAGTLTLSVTGHTHLIQLPGGTRPYGDGHGATAPYEVILGNAGAPLDAGDYYGYAILRRRTGDGAVVVQTYESMSSDGVTSLDDAADPNFRFAVNANGTANTNTALP